MPQNSTLKMVNFMLYICFYHNKKTEINKAHTNFIKGKRSKHTTALEELEKVTKELPHRKKEKKNK